jgi:adhesin/invasin
MPARTHGVTVVFLVLCLGLFVLQSGCSTSGGGGTETSPGNSNALHLTLSSPSGSTAVVADGHSTIPLRMQVTNASGAGVSGLPVTFATNAGVLSPSSVVGASRDLLSTDQPDQTPTTRADSTGSVTVNTDANGIAQVFLTASTVAGTAVVTADVQGFRSNIVIDFVPGPPVRMQLTASPPTVSPAGTSTLTATVTDANGNLSVNEQSARATP